MPVRALNNKRAIEVNIQIVRILTGIREMLLTHKDLLFEMEIIRKKMTEGNTKSIELLFEYVGELLVKKEK